jgi:hypothetical protein
MSAVCRRGAAEAIHEAIAFAEGAVDHPFSFRESASLDALLALRVTMIDVWPFSAGNLLADLDQLEDALNR